MEFENMKSIAYDYFTTQVGYNLAIAPLIKAEVKRLWLEGCEVGEVAKRMLNGKLMIESVIRCKKFITVWVTIDIDSETHTRAIIHAFLAYIKKVYNEVDAEVEVNKPGWLKAVDARIDAILADAN